MKHTLLLTLSLLLFSFHAYAGEVTITAAHLDQQSTGSYQVSVTLFHDDTGWEHYADGWRIVDEKGNVIATRTLFHPHVNEQPFTRSLNNVVLDAQLNTVYIEAHDTVHSWSQKRLKINLTDLQNGKLTVKANKVPDS